MYESYYGLREKPFNLTPDPKYLYLSGRHAEAFAHLEYGFKERGGFVVITGEVGMGKTTLARYFLGHLEPGTATAVVLYPSMTAAELLQTVNTELHLPPIADLPLSDSIPTKPLVDALHRFLLEARARSQRVVLVIDEAQGLTRDALEQVRLISNLETDTEKLIQIILIGQSELKEMLARRDLRQLAQRITARYHLGPFDFVETEAYVRHRLAVAGGEGKVTFTRKALLAVHNRSSGIPRLINLICDRSLLAGYVAGTREIDGPMVDRAAGEVFGDAPPRQRQTRYLPLIVGAVACLAALAAYRYALGERSTPRSAAPTPAPLVASALPVAASAEPPGPPMPSPTTATTQTLGLPDDRGAGLLAPLDAVPETGSWAAAFGAVRALWPVGSPLRATSFRSSFEHIRRFDLPVILELDLPHRAETCFVPVLGLAGDRARIALPGGTSDVPIAQLERYWTRLTSFPWRDFDGLGDGPRPADAWVGWALSRLGRPATGSLGAAVSAFQRESGLVADGIPGPRTIVALYSALPYARPRLSTASPLVARVKGGA